MGTSKLQTSGSPTLSPKQTAWPKKIHLTWLRNSLLHFMLRISGRRPFHEDSASAIKQLPDNIPFRLRQIVMQCLAKNPDERRQTFAALFDEIAAFSRTNGFTTSIPQRYSISGIEQSLSSSQWN